MTQQELHSLLSRCLLSTLNATVDDINNKILEDRQGEEFVFYNIDDIPPDLESHAFMCVPEDYLYSLTPSCLPPHKL